MHITIVINSINLSSFKFLSIEFQVYGICFKFQFKIVRLFYTFVIIFAFSFMNLSLLFYQLQFEHKLSIEREIIWYHCDNFHILTSWNYYHRITLQDTTIL